MARTGLGSVAEMLGGVPLLSTCDKDELRLIAGLGSRITAPAGTKLTEQGKPGSDFFLLLRGRTRCVRDGVTVAEFGPGDFFAEMALIRRGPSHATVMADGPVEVLVLAHGDFDRMLDTSPSIAKKMLGMLARTHPPHASVHS